MTNKELIYQYWYKTEFGRKMIKSNYVSDSDLWFLIPNNKKKMLGLPLTRIPGKQKRKKYKQRRVKVFSFRLFDLIEETIETTLLSTWTENEWFGQFVDIKNFDEGDKQYFVEEIW